jgi:serine/threonine protein kinase/HEAT repeat protein
VGDETLDLEGLLRDLESPTADIRRRALFKLGKALDLRAIPHVKRIAAEDESQEARYLARKLLALYEARRPEAGGLIRPGGSHPSLVNALDTPASIETALASPNPAARAAALKAVTDRKETALLPAVLKRSAQGADGKPVETVPELRSLLPQAIAALGGRAHVQAIVAFVDDADPRVRANALTALQAVGDPASWAFVIRSVQDPDHRVRTAAISALSKLGRVNVIKCCTIMIERSGNQYWQRDSAIALLAKSGLPEAVPLLEAALTDPVPGIAQKAFKGLQGLAAKGCEPAKKSLEVAIQLGIGEEKPEDFLKLEDARGSRPGEHDTGIRRELTKAVLANAGTNTIVGQMKLESDVPTLVGMLQNLAKKPDPAALPMLEELMRHDAEEVRGECVRALIAIGTPDALGLVVPALNDPSPVVASRALLALEKQQDSVVRAVAADARQKVVEGSAALQTIDSGSPESPATPPGETDDCPFSPAFLAGYELIKPLGQGGMGAVYLMRQKKLDRPVAVKVVRRDRFTKEESDRLLKEARVLASVHHASIVAIHDVGTDGEIPYMVCEYVEGETLQARLAGRAPMPVAEALRIACQILEGLDAAHRAGVQHRDLKPANLLLDIDGKPKIVDFGLARSEKAPPGASIGSIAGTPAYMSPEQARGQVTTAATDLYAIGVIAFEMATGRHPFPGPSMMDYLIQHSTQTPPAARSLRPEIAPELEAALARALEKDPAKRYRTAAEMRDALLAPLNALTGPAPSKPGVTWTAGAVLAQRYVLEKLVHEGGIESVWLAQDRMLDGRTVALRLLPPALAADAQARATLVSEGERGAKLAHPAILRTIGVEAGDPPFVVTEVAEGRTLADELARRKAAGDPPLPAGEALAVLDAVAAALDHAHAAGILHLEVTPARIVLGSAPKLAQFGLAAELNKMLAASTGDVPADVLAFLSPEQLSSQPLDARADVFSLAATAAALGLGGEVIARATSPDRARRPASAGAFVKELRAALEGAPAPEAVAHAPAPAPAAVAPPPAPPAAAGSRRGLLIAVIAALALALALAVRLIR